MRQRAPRLLTALVVLLAAAAAADPGSLKVGASFDYVPFSQGDPEAPGGFDAAVLRAYASDRGLALEWQRFHWAELLGDLEAGRFDLAASGVTVRPERSAAGRFSVAVAETGALLLARNPGRWRALTSFNRPQVRIGVNAGGHLERVARAHFPRATLVAIADNAAVATALAEGVVDAALTDSLEAPHWEAQAGQDLERVGPFTHDRKAWLVRAERSELAADLDAWLLAREADGTLARLREEHLGVPMPPTATPLAALLAAVDERLSMMPLVGFVKRRDGVPLEVPEREAAVIDAALADVRAAATAAGREPPPDAAIRDFFRAQMDAAKQVQWRAVKDPDFEPTAPLPDLDTALRPGLLRIGSRIARLLLELPADLDPEQVARAAAQSLHAPYLTAESREALARAIAACGPASAGTGSEGGKARNESGARAS